MAATTMRVPKPLALPSQTGQDLDAIDPEAGSETKAHQMLASPRVEHELASTRLASSFAEQLPGCILVSEFEPIDCEPVIHADGNEELGLYVSTL